MNKATIAILLFGLLVLAVTAPFAGLANVMLFLIGGALLWTIWTVSVALISGETSVAGQMGEGGGKADSTEID